MSLEDDWAKAKPVADLSADWAKAKPVGSPTATATPEDDTSLLGRAKALPGAMREAVGSVAEPLMAMGSDAAAYPVSRVAGLTQLVMQGARRAGVPGIEERDPLTVQEDVQRAMTYEPRTTAGKATTEYNPIALLGKLLEAASGGLSQLGAPPEGKQGPAESAIRGGVKEALTQAPMFAGLKAPPAAAAAGAGVRGGAERLMHSALKPGIKYAKSAESGIDTLLEKGINVTPGGLEKLQGQIGDLNSRIAQLIQNSPAVIDKPAVAARLYDTLERFKKQVDPKADLATIERTWENFMEHPLLTGSDIPVKTAQEVKQGTYTQLKGKYGELGSAETEAQKALARGLKEEIAKAVPEVRQLNAEESKLLTALPMVERRVIISANKNPVGLGLLSMNPKNIAVWMADRSELFKSLVARMLNAGSKTLPPIGRAGPALGFGVTSQADQLQPPPQ
ncbi:MAG: hypothetical protein ACYDAE_21630 [Steroidobacteraceae bacterium]